MQRKPFVRRRGAPRPQNRDSDLLMRDALSKQRGHINGYCPQCEKRTRWKELRAFIVPKNAPVASQVETQVARQCLECGRQHFF